jgi:hypothetical protein
MRSDLEPELGLAESVLEGTDQREEVRAGAVDSTHMQLLTLEILNPCLTNQEFSRQDSYA